MGGSHRHLFDDGDDDDVYMYPTGMNPDKRADYRASKSSEWN